MSRYNLLLGKSETEPEPVSEPEKIDTPCDLLEASKRLKKGSVKGKGVEQVWEIEDQTTTVSLERSPRDSTCAKCRKKIPRGTPRYKRVGPGFYSEEVNYYHRRCCPPHVRKFIREYNNRDLEREDMEECLKSTVYYVRSMVDNKYAQEYYQRVYDCLQQNQLEALKKSV